MSTYLVKSLRINSDDKFASIIYNLLQKRKYENVEALEMEGKVQTIPHLKDYDVIKETKRHYRQELSSIHVKSMKEKGISPLISYHPDTNLTRNKLFPHISP